MTVLPDRTGTSSQVQLHIEIYKRQGMKHITKFFYIIFCIMNSSTMLKHKSDEIFIHQRVQQNRADNMIFHILNKIEGERCKNLKYMSPNGLKCRSFELSLPLFLKTWISHSGMLTANLISRSD